MADFLIRNAAAILTGLRGDAARARGSDIRVRGGVIEAVGALVPAPGERIYDATDCVVYPGWVNTHHHLFQSVMKGIPAGLNVPLLEWLAAVPVRYRRYLTPERLRLAATIGMAELLLSGCTTIADHHYAYWPGMSFDGSALMFEVAEQLGVRYVLLRGGATKVRDFDRDAPPESQPETLDAMLAGIERDVARFHQARGDAMRRVVLAPSTPTWSVHPHELPELARAARRLGIMIHSHLSETADYVKFCREVHGCLPVEFVAKHEWLGADVWYAHLVHCAPSEVKLLAETGTGMSHCPQSNCRLGSGIAPAPALAAAGGKVTLGVDGTASNEGGDMINETRQAWFVHRANEGAHATTVEEVVHWGTAAGANMMGLDRVGAIAPGYAADITVFSLDALRYAGVHDVAVAPVICGGDARVKFGFCAGQLVVSHGQIPGLDVAKILADARQSVREMQ